MVYVFGIFSVFKSLSFYIKGRNCNLPSTHLTWSEHTSNNSNYSVALIEHGGDQLLPIVDTGSFGDDNWLLSIIDIYCLLLKFMEKSCIHHDA